MRLVLDLRPLHHGQHGAAAHTGLQLLGDGPLVAGEELAGEPALARERGCANLAGELANPSRAPWCYR